MLAFAKKGSKLNGFRAQPRGVQDLPFFMF